MNKPRLFVVILAISVGILSQCVKQQTAQKLSENFDKKYGQVAVGGYYAGAEFHHSRPTPSRISFYYPVANSLDLSRDYWKRDQSRPFIYTLTQNNQTDTIGWNPATYSYTPGWANFYERHSHYTVTYRYRFADDLPAISIQIVIQNTSDSNQLYRLNSYINPTLRTSHTYAWKYPDEIIPMQNQSGVKALYHDSATDSTALFVLNRSDSVQTQFVSSPDDSTLSFEYVANVSPDDSMVVQQILGTSKQSDADSILEEINKRWGNSAAEYQQKIRNAVQAGEQPELPDQSLVQTANWSKALLMADQHYIDGTIIPMPCPAEYNFFFTHDLLLTDLGAVNYDFSRVKRDLLYLKSLTKPDSILPHAYYWKDTQFATEFCSSDNWNHLWFIIMTSKYLKHSDDLETAQALYPILTKSLAMMLTNLGSDTLMYSYRPDWWDIGHVYGARSYLTILTIHALQDYVFISQKLGRTDQPLNEYLHLSRQLKSNLIQRFWSEKFHYLFNMLDTLNVDTHYYSGSLLAADYNILDQEKQKALLETAQSVLLDQNLGIRNVMPPDFNDLIDRYKFNGMEMGRPYLYINGGIWPQGTHWYVQGLIASEQPEVALRVLKKYLTLSGIVNSPNGQPSFYEYRDANPKSPNYGKIDKPTFLWAGGWYLNTLYQLMGVRTNPWALYFSPHIPAEFSPIHYTITLLGEPTRVTMEGTGKYFSGIVMDGNPVHSAVVTQPARQITLTRGEPQDPYLANADCRISQVTYDTNKNILQVTALGEQLQKIHLTIISADTVLSINHTAENQIQTLEVTREKSAIKTEFRTYLSQSKTTYSFKFH